MISSNLGRLLYHFTGCDDSLVRDWFGKLKEQGRYEVNDAVKTKLSELFYAGCCSDEETKAQIKATFSEHSYLLDTHTAVAVKVYEDYIKATGDKTPTVIASTANPYKFGRAVYEAVGGKAVCDDEFDLISHLEQETGTKMPAPLAATRNKQVRFTGSVEKQDMGETVLGFLGK